MKEGGGDQRKSSSNILAKTLQKCRSLGGGGHHRRHHPSSASSAGSCAPPSPSPHHHRPMAWSSVPAGCFAVLVGPEKERFAVRARCANHPLFRALLDEAETEYGFAGCDGPLELPCAVDDFMEVMWEMEQQGAHGGSAASPRCARFAGASRHQQGYHMMSPGSSFLVAGRS